MWVFCASFPLQCWPVSAGPSSMASHWKLETRCRSWRNVKVQHAHAHCSCENRFTSSNHKHACTLWHWGSDRSGKRTHTRTQRLSHVWCTSTEITRRSSYLYWGTPWQSIHTKWAASCLWWWTPVEIRVCYCFLDHGLAALPAFLPTLSLFFSSTCFLWHSLSHTVCLSLCMLICFFLPSLSMMGK